MDWRLWTDRTDIYVRFLYLCLPHMYFRTHGGFQMYSWIGTSVLKFSYDHNNKFKVMYITSSQSISLAYDIRSEETTCHT